MSSPTTRTCARPRPSRSPTARPRCLGFSTGYGKTVRTLITNKLPVSVSLAIAAFVIWMVGGVLFGVIAALFKGTIIDRGIVGLSLIAFAFPTFFIGLLLLKFVSIRWGLVDLPQYKSIGDFGVYAWLTSLTLPAITLALVYMAGYIRMTRAFVLETMTEDYIRTARAKGLTQRAVIGKHTLRAVLTPLVTLSGSTWPACSAARSSPRRSSTTTGSASCPSPRSSGTTCP